MKKILANNFNIENIIKNLPKDCAIIVRQYEMSKAQRENFAQKIIATARPLGLKILIAKDFALAKKLKADGVHFSDQDSLKINFKIAKKYCRNFIFSFSCHSLKSVLKAFKLKPDVIFISPIFATSSHLDAKILGIKNLAKITLKTKSKNYCNSAIYALGGINENNLIAIRKLKIAGFGAIDLFLKN